MTDDDKLVQRITDAVEGMREEIVETLTRIIRVPAISPVSDGKGELKKTELIQEIISSWGFDEVVRYDAPDDSAEGEVRPNIIAKLWGEHKDGPTLWAVAHTDVVPVGDLSLWTTEPFEPVVKDGKIYGRGSEDNGQSLVATMFGAKTLIDLKIKPKYNIGLALVADEETGSHFGIRYLLKQNIFKPDDLIVVPDSGNPEGTQLEVSEKTILWVKVNTTGKQCHASLPELGINAFKAATKFGYLADSELYSTFNHTDPMFDPPESTFEMTKKEANVDNINTIPGSDVFYFDCRILPHYDPEEIWQKFQELARQVEDDTGAKIGFERVQFEPAAPPTSPDAPVVQLLKTAIESVYGIEAQPRGIGGGTCGAFFRRAGFPTVVWSKIDDTCHAPNEYCVIDNLINDCKVFSVLFASK
ncbi:M20 family metallo-hydrolase [[Eubacterium] cellulosolvens]